MFQGVQRVLIAGALGRWAHHAGIRPVVFRLAGWRRVCRCLLLRPLPTQLLPCGSVWLCAMDSACGSGHLSLC